MTNNNFSKTGNINVDIFKSASYWPKQNLLRHIKINSPFSQNRYSLIFLKKLMFFGNKKDKTTFSILAYLALSAVLFER